MHSVISRIEYHLPLQTLSTDDLAAEFPKWSVEKIDKKTGIKVRHIALKDEYASDLAVYAAQKLFHTGLVSAQDIDFILLCTQSPDYIIPTTACILQDRLGIPTTAGALDYNLGCSGFIYGLGIAEGLVCSGQAKSILLLTADTYSKYLDRDDFACRSIFADGAAATLIVARDLHCPTIGPFIYGTDGGRADSLILRGSGTGHFRQLEARGIDSELREGSTASLRMDGPKIFSFAMDTVPRLVLALLEKAKMKPEEIDLFVFHQANAYILEALREHLGIPHNKIVISLADSGNTISSTIPIALKNALSNNILEQGHRVMLIGFGVGLSWGATIVIWSAS